MVQGREVGHASRDEQGLALLARDSLELEAPASVRGAGRRCLALVDTGAEQSLMSPRLAAANQGPTAAAVGLRVGRHSFPLGAPRISTDLGEVVSRSLGVEVDFILGMDFLGQFDRVVLDYSRQNLALIRTR